MIPKQANGEPFQVTATHATAASASKAAATGKVHYITDASASSDKAGAILLIKDGTTTIWQVQMPANGSVNLHFVNPLKGTSGNAVSVDVDGTAACKSNIAGFTLKQ
jgi:hypothetical protein